MTNSLNQFKKYLIGRSITKWTKDTITLDNGITLTLFNDHDCCAYALGVFEKLKQHVVITDITVDSVRKEPNSIGEMLTLHLLYDAGDAGQLNLSYSPSNGYYAAVCELVVNLPKPLTTMNITDWKDIEVIPLINEKGKLL